VAGLAALITLVVALLLIAVSGSRDAFRAESFGHRMWPGVERLRYYGLTLR
jgi:hypothetical protein